MTTQLNFSASANPLSALVGAGLADAKAAPVAADAPGGSHFAELFTGHMLKLERQGIAAAQDALSSLQVMPLGPGINVITSDAPVPDMQSLVAFAKAQGLDDAAVAGLFGDVPAVPTLEGLSPGAAQAFALPAAVPAFGSAFQSPTLGSLQGLPGVSILGLEMGSKPASADRVSAVSTADVLASLGVAVVKEGGHSAPDVPALPPEVLADPSPQAAASVLAAQAAQAIAAAAQPAELATSATAAVDALQTKPPMVDALRVQMGIPGAEITRRLAQLAGMQGSVTWAELVAHAAAEQAQTGAAALQVAAAQSAADAVAGASAPRLVGSALGSGPDAALALAAVAAANAAGADALGRATVPRTAASALGMGGDAALALAALATDKGAVAHAAAAADAAGAAAKLSAPALAAAQVALDAASLQQLGTEAAPRQLSEEEELVIDVPSGMDLGDLSDHAGVAAADAGAARHPERTGAAAPAQSAADATRAAIQERAAQTQLLADRMGQALASKLISQIERGQWKMQMRLQPGALGRVEVALDMHAGGLDAVFSTDNALTKDLLGQGANRLREALTQSGTTVASVTVNADARGQSGGNSTPQKRQTAPQQSAAPTPVAATAVQGGRYTGTVAEGLNVLA